jgi:hypothetical protein
MNYIYCCNYFSFNLFDLGKLVYLISLLHHSKYLQKQVRCAPVSQQLHVPGMLTTVGVFAILKKGTKCDSKMARMKTSLTDRGGEISPL